MPRIETYSSTGPSQIRQSQASDFADTTGLREMSKVLGEAGAEWELKAKKLKETENRLFMARTLAQGRQEWMLKLDERQRAADESGSFEGFTDSFNKDYAEWADNIAATVKDPQLQEELRVNLIEMQTPLMGGAMSYEAAKRAERIKKDYNDMLVPIITDIRGARTQPEIDAALIGNSQSVNMLPPDVRSDAMNKIRAIEATQRLDVAKDETEIEQVVQAVRSGEIPELTPEQANAIMGTAESARNRLRVTAERNVQQTIQAATSLAQTGDLQPGWSGDLNIELRKLEPGSEADTNIRTAIQRLDFVNRISREVWGMTTYQYEEALTKTQMRVQNGKTTEEQAAALSELGVIQEAWNKRNELLSKDYANVAMQKDELTNQAYKDYQSALESGDVEKSQQLFTKYVDSLEGYAKNINWQGDVNYLPAAEVQQVSREIQTALQKENGVVAAADKIDQYQAQYGNKFVDVMRQLRKENESFGALSMIPRIMSNGSMRNDQQVKKNILIQALNKQINTPDIYKGLKPEDYALDFLDKKVIAVSKYSPVEMQDRMMAYEATAKMLKLQGDSNYAKNAMDVAFGDIKEYNDIVYPAAVEDIGKVVSGAGKLFSIEKDITPPSYAEDFEKANIAKNPTAYIEWRTAPKGEGLMAVWKAYDSYGSEPVRRKDGSTVIYTWGQGDAAGVIIPSSDKQPIMLH